MAAIGLATGAGYYSAAVITTVVVLLSLWPLRIVAFRMFERLRPGELRLEVELRANESPVSPARSAGSPRHRRALVRGRGRPRPSPGRAGLPRDGGPARAGDRGADAPRAGARGAVGHVAVLASSNENKLRELRHALEGWTIELLGADDYPPETGETYYENARAKAEFARARARDRWVLGEDSGVEIDGLGGGPGVLSARWAAGREAERALEELEGVDGDGRNAQLRLRARRDLTRRRGAPRHRSPRRPDRRRSERRRRLRLRPGLRPRTAKKEPLPSWATTGSARTPTEHAPPAPSMRR